jgi:hypothetical protein
MATDNSDGPLTIALICGIISNPLLFLHISYPNRVSNVIDCLCKSGHMLYFFIWVYYIHTKSKFADKIQYRVYLAIKMVFCSLIYILNFIRLLHYQVGIVESLITVIVLFMLCLYLWDAYLNLQYQHHRDKILVSVTLTFLGCLFAFKFLSRHWKN